jgi:hypothetical protein
VTKASIDLDTKDKAKEKGSSKKKSCMFCNFFIYFRESHKKNLNLMTSQMMSLIGKTPKSRNES